MWFCNVYTICLVIYIHKVDHTEALFRIFPEDVATGFAAIYGFSPRIVKGNDHRVGFGFRFGNHADLQLVYELGPQLTTNRLQTTRVRSATIRQRTTRRRPLLELFIRKGLFRNIDYELDYNDNEYDEPR